MEAIYINPPGGSTYLLLSLQSPSSSSRVPVLCRVYICDTTPPSVCRWPHRQAIPPLEQTVAQSILFSIREPEGLRTRTRKYYDIFCAVMLSVLFYLVGYWFQGAYNFLNSAFLDVRPIFSELGFPYIPDFPHLPKRK